MRTYAVRFNTDTGSDYYTIDMPEQTCFYHDFNTHEDKLTTYGKGYVDGAAYAHFNYLPHPSVKLTSTDSDTRRAYVLGYREGYDANTRGIMPHKWRN